MFRSLPFEPESVMHKRAFLFGSTPLMTSVSFFPKSWMDCWNFPSKPCSFVWPGASLILFLMLSSNMSLFYLSRPSFSFIASSLACSVITMSPNPIEKPWSIIICVKVLWLLFKKALQYSGEKSFQITWIRPPCY